ncbi:MAG: DUF624 domain-containing protein [Anaerolineae bacterium]|nr:DUF624 domain-containing protein [Anaerolineae bacterium]
MMGEAWQVIRAAWRQTGADIFTTLVVNLLWLVLCAFVITAPAATVALFYVTNRLAHEEPTDVGDFFLALRRYFGVGGRWGLVNLLVLFFLGGDLFLTGRLVQEDWRPWVQGFYAAALLAWLIVQFYALPFLFEQEHPSVRLALRNGAVMLGRNIGFTLALMLLLGIVLVVTTLFFLVIAAAGGIIIALIANHAVLNRLAAAKIPHTA